MESREGEMYLRGLRELRYRVLLTQRELAERAGLTQRTIHLLESGARRARPSTVRRLTEALGVDSQELMAAPPGALDVQEDE